MAALFAEPLLRAFQRHERAARCRASQWLSHPLVIYAVELIVAFVQAYVFTVLAAVYIQIAEAEGH